MAVKMLLNRIFVTYQALTMDPKQAKKFTTIHYHSYLELDKILDAQHPRSEVKGEVPAHEEMLFIVVHQVYELWFKQILHELSSLLEMFENDRVDERNTGTAVARLDRLIEIMELLIQQIRVLETMTPLDFLDFRSYLFPASGFQSFQFRMVENMLGLPREQRMTYNQAEFDIVFTEEQKERLRKVEQGGTLFNLVEAWLERTPFLEFRNFSFLTLYEAAVERMLGKERAAILDSKYLLPESREIRLRVLDSTAQYYQNVFDPARHEALKASGELRLSYKATLAALLVKLYRDEPILQMPFNLLGRLTDLDELLTTWRYRHAQMVLRMLGKKVGTGGSSGHDYLSQTAAKHHIFKDLHNISTLLIPRSELPPLPEEVKRELGFFFTQQV